MGWESFSSLLRNLLFASNLGLSYTGLPKAHWRSQRGRVDGKRALLGGNPSQVHSPVLTPTNGSDEKWACICACRAGSAESSIAVAGEKNEAAGAFKRC